VNQQLFAMVCANTVGISPDLDPAACFANVFGSPNATPANPVLGFGPRVVVALNTVLRGDTSGGLAGFGAVIAGVGEFPADGSVQAAIAANRVDGLPKVTVDLNIDGNDGDNPDFANASPDNPLLQLAPATFGNEVAFFYDPAGLFAGSLSGRLTDWQEALLGCGPFYHTSCDLDGIDLLNAEASALLQSFPNVDGTFRGADKVWDTTDKGLDQPGTRGFDGGPRCTRYVDGKTLIIPGCRGPGDDGYNVAQDGSVGAAVHPFTGQPWQNELGIFSWNLLMVLTALSLPPRDFGDTTGPRHAADRGDFDVNDPFRKGGCSFAEPQWCGSVTAFLGLAGNRRNSIRAGGNGVYGRKDFVWQSGQMGVARYDKSNVLGFSADFAEDVTKSNWGVEFTWVNDVHNGDNNSFDGTDLSDSYRLTISVDRPTFINFLNANRTFFFNTQWFFQYTDHWNNGYTIDGPWDIFGVVSVGTGYFQDRLLPSLTVVYFVMNNSLAFLPDITYRFTENFQVTFGIAAFMGREEERPMPIDEFSIVGTRFGRNAYKSSVENGLAVIRERDEIFLRLRYTF
jgi:hypothetical protein